MSGRAYPWHKFYPCDWLADPALLQCSIETEGAWIRTCATMMHQGTASMTRTLEKWARLWRVDKVQAAHIIADLDECGVADVEMDLEKLSATIASRRIKRDMAERSNTRQRVTRHRKKRDCNANVTALKQTEPEPEPEPEYTTPPQDVPLSQEILGEPIRAEAAQELWEHWLVTVHPRDTGQGRAFKAMRVMDRAGKFAGAVVKLRRAMDNFATALPEDRIRPNLATWLESGDYCQFMADDWKPPKAKEAQLGY